MSGTPVLRKHLLRHISELEVSGDVIRCRFEKTGSMSNCQGGCCALGVDVDIAQRDHILEHAELVRRHMDASQDPDPRNWFGESFEDSDFPSGQAASTNARNGACVFLDANGWCALHRAETQTRSEAADLKPFFCRAYPLTIENGVLRIDREQNPGATRCCGPVEGGALTIFDVCASELEHVLGAAGLGELRKIADTTEP